MDLAECLATIATGTNKDMLQIDLTTLSVKDASKLAKHKGPLDFVGLTTLSAQVATELAKHKGTLFLGLTTLTEKVAGHTDTECRWRRECWNVGAHFMKARRQHTFYQQDVQDGSATNWPARKR